MTAEEFKVRERIQGATKKSVILKGNNGEQIFCMNRIFNAIMQDPGLQVRVVTLPAHHARCSGCLEKEYPETKWLEAYLPTRM